MSDRPFETTVAFHDLGVGNLDQRLSEGRPRPTFRRLDLAGLATSSPPNDEDRRTEEVHVNRERVEPMHVKGVLVSDQDCFFAIVRWSHTQPFDRWNLP